MPKPTETQLQNLGRAVRPFERTGFKRKVLEGESVVFQGLIYDATHNDYPENVLTATPKAIFESEAENTKYLWIINQNGLFIIPEQTSNTAAIRGVVCHTNITGGQEAIQGGELWFGTNGVVYINNKSGRYGATTIEERLAILDYFRSVGYTKVEQIK